MELRAFVLAVKEERDAILGSYIAPEPTTFVGSLIREAALSKHQRERMIAALYAALTDAFYTMLLGLDGAASLGGIQQSYRLQDESGRLISDGTGELEAVAHELFQER